MVSESNIGKAQATEVSQTEEARSGVWYRPNVDILETADELMVVADVPGSTPEGIDVHFEDGTLTIHAPVARRHEDGDFFVREYGVGDYYRTFQVNELVDAEKIAAEYADGVLSVRLKKTPTAASQRIDVKVK